MKTLASLLVMIGGLLVAPMRGVEFGGRVERLDPALDAALAAEAKVEKLAEGFQWAEGPVWFEGAVVFSDVPRDTAYRWREGMTAAEIFLQPSGLLSAEPAVREKFREPGSNGLAVDRQGRLLLCQHGERRVARWVAGKFETVAERCDGKRFNTPNDLAVRRSGEIYFTDPPYGFLEVETSPLRETPWHGVYRIGTDGAVTLLTKALRYPNGIAFSPDERTLYVGCTEDGHPHIVAFAVREDGTLGDEREFFDARPLAKAGAPGSCDGLKVDREGRVWATGPGGVLVIDAHGKLLGRILTGVPTANCGWGDDGGTLYITAQNALLRVKTRTKGAGW